MSEIRPFNASDPGFLVNQDGSASFNSPWKECNKDHCVSFTIAWTAVASTAGTLSFQGTDDPAKAATSLVTLTVTTTHGTYPTVSTSAAAALLILENPPRFVRLVYTRSAGGGANQFNVFVTGRST